MLAPAEQHGSASLCSFLVFPNGSLQCRPIGRLGSRIQQNDQVADRRSEDLALPVSSDRIEELLLEPDHHEMRAEAVRDHDHAIAAARARIASVQSEFGIDAFEERYDGWSDLLADRPSGQERG
jgi:hypothetical protein